MRVLCEAVTFPGADGARKHSVTCADIESCMQKAVSGVGTNFPEQFLSGDYELRL